MKPMKKIEATIRKEKLDIVEEELARMGVSNVLIVNTVKNEGIELRYATSAKAFVTSKVPYAKIELVVPSEMAKEIARDLLRIAGAGTVMLYEVEDMMIQSEGIRIETEESQDL
jgi:nitrogen regulatory protein PII